MLNSIICQGRLTADPVKKTTQSGVSVVSFTVACDRDFKNGDEKVADFIDVTAWRHTADFVANNFTKGRMIVVSGSLQSRKWEDKDGNKRTSWEIQAQNVYFADSKRDGGGQGQTEPTGGGFKDIEEADGDLPF